MRRSRAPSNWPGPFFAARSRAGCTTNMFGFDLRQAQGAEATAGRRLRGGVEPQATGDTGGCADFLTARRKPNTDCLGLFQAAQGTRALDPAAVGEEGRGTED